MHAVCGPVLCEDYCRLKYSMQTGKVVNTRPHLHSANNVGSTGPPCRSRYGAIECPPVRVAAWDSLQVLRMILTRRLRGLRDLFERQGNWSEPRVAVLPAVPAVCAH